MNYKTITYQRVKSLGNYESERLELTAEVTEDEDIKSAISTLKDRVNHSLGKLTPTTHYLDDETVENPF